MRPLTALLLSALVIRGLLPTTRAQAQADDASAQADQLYRQARAQHEAGNYEQAALLAERAFELTHASPLLYNAARSWEEAGQLERALDHFRRYLGQPDLSDLDRRDGQEAVARVEAALDAPRSTPVVVLTPPSDPDVRPEHPEPGDEAPAREPPWGGIGVGIGAAAALVVAVSLGGASRSYRDAALASTFAVTRANFAGAANDLAVGANVFYAIAGAAAIASAVWMVVELTSEPSSASAAVGLGPGGVYAAGSF